MKARDRPLPEIAGNLPICQTIVELTAIADEASQGVGSHLRGDESEIDERFLYHAAELLERKLPGSSVCEEIDASRLRVLPKMHTPQSGLTVRSLSLYLALFSGNEVVPEWVQLTSPLEGEGLNLLIVPWPTQIYPAQFRVADPPPAEMRNMPEQFGFFTFEHKKAERNVVDVVASLYERAEEQVKRIHGVVLPELALSSEEHDALRADILPRGSFLVSGVGRSSRSPTSHGENQVCLDIPFNEPLFQHKHHRWKLDGPQVMQYNLGSILYPEREWWEHIGLAERRCLFASIHPDMILSVLVCEDLARPDPVGDLVRAVGPNLVITVLMDGPQLKERWSGRYATTLADDPGCSVLSITSLGMSKLSRPRSGPSRSQVIALWKDAKNGVATEVELEPGAEAVVLSLSMQYREEWTADGRCDNGNAVYPMLSGLHCVKTT